MAILYRFRALPIEFKANRGTRLLSSVSRELTGFTSSTARPSAEDLALPSTFFLGQRFR